MKWSWKIGRIAGIDVSVHATFMILILWIALAYWREGGSLAAVIEGVGFVLALFGCVVLHEVGHALAARRYGIATRQITLLPIGGVASMERMPDDPRQEIAVALAGPAVNLAIGATLWLGLSLAGLLQVGVPDPTGSSFVERLLVVNLILAVFNLLPAFPMDGGRVLRAALSMRMSHNHATQVAARVGQGFALWLGFVGLLYNPFLLFIALFVWIGAASEAGMEQVRSTLSHVVAGRAMLTDFQALAVDDRLVRAIELTLAGSQKVFPVLRGAEPIGVLTQDGLLKGLQAGGEQAPVVDWMQPGVESADVAEPLQQVLQRLQNCDCPLLCVTRDGRLAGIINVDNILELVKIESALQERAGGGGFAA